MVWALVQFLGEVAVNVAPRCPGCADHHNAPTPVGVSRWIGLLTQCNAVLRRDVRAIPATEKARCGSANTSRNAG